MEKLPRKQVLIALIQNDLTQGVLAKNFKCSQPYVSMAINGVEVGPKALAIREFVQGLFHRKAA